jgi:RNA polymerase sigma factor (sigma-70 family)
VTVAVAARWSAGRGSVQPEATESTLIARARSGDERAFAELVTRHRKHIWAVCVRITNNGSDAEDALQEALTAAWQHLDKFRGDAKFSTWMHRIAANAALSVVRRRRDVLTDDFELEDTGSDQYREFDETDRVQAALRQVPPDFRAALVLREYGGLSYDEIAVHQGIPVATVKSRLNRAKKALAEALTVSG